MSGIVCPHCEALVLSSYKCSNCTKVLPIIETNPFSLLGLPAAFGLTKVTIQEALIKKLLIYHPDKFALADSLTKKIITENSALLNTAARTLKDEVKRAENLLLIRGFDLNNNQDLIHQQVLLDSLEIQEQIEGANTKGACEVLLDCILKQLEYNYQEMAVAFEKTDLNPAYKLVVKRNFLLRAKCNIENKLEKLYEVI
ncbi:MAG: Fe-S protein assembly co-chaperone HscB [Candidatus Midichloria mitochondrii]|uniref:Co-chaperone Hsc20 n=1 Tax=Midichloria mitochondrii (strain IricVA) TaxID=696127 RepID=F7XVE2_MIDMI|nr:Fe-S protein assembly co-chaperone HscB [Candidatus Midichloria mitochondrii]AEI88641.1 co-chaperone Hsc20 [Candidatus Midichloria mitochondrii IricVA]MDJ1256584.1 Fe-S protein assembly co-chaperone HscB [Candidatus Midichloria mitochondrii]MDJ1288305.1 Fe-S protein assembly co-chaperone HscB [Candidatus Midichloria mitochondrii]MDJ1299169.1 Fe-S protein assembly co-chaperone HscB [Candidatus Midichloria mitochondrii]MDJ1312856.1 Fe-S protein assembly co-chaperone HscB [Candidatus Midichlor